MSVRSCMPKLWPSYCLRHKEKHLWHTQVESQDKGQEKGFPTLLTVSPVILQQKKKITQDSERAKRSTVIIFPWERGFSYTRNVDVATESVNHSVKQTITDCIIVILLTIWATEQPFWLKHWLWFMNSQKTVQLNKSRMWVIMKIFPKSPPLPLRWKVRKSFIMVEERLSSCSWDVPATQLHYLTVSKEDRKQNATEMARNLFAQESPYPKDKSLFLKIIFMGAIQQCKLH